MRLSGIGIWSGHLRAGGDPALAAEAAAELEELGYTALWLPGFTDGPLVEPISTVLGATTRLVAATGILNVWMREAARTAADFGRIQTTHPERFLLGLGISHSGIVKAIRARVQAHRDAGADHVCLQVLQADAAALPREQWRELAGILID